MNKAIDAANNRIEMWLKNCHSRYVMKESSINPEHISQLRPPAHVYLVPSESDPSISYVVDMESRLCSCPQGRLTGPCKHKDIVAKTKNLPSFDLIPTNSPKMRQMYMFIATGQHMALDWFLGLQAVPDCEGDVQQCESPVPVLSNNNDTEDAAGTSAPTYDVVPEDIKTKFKETVAALTEKVMARIDKDPTGYRKAVEIFEKTVKRLPSSVDTALQKSLCSFGKSVTQVFRMNILNGLNLMNYL